MVPKAALGCDAGMTITFHIFRADHRGDTTECAAPLTAGKAKEELQYMDSSWIGWLRDVGNSVLLPREHVLADGATYELLLQRQSGGH